MTLQVARLCLLSISFLTLLVAQRTPVRAAEVVELYNASHYGPFREYSPGVMQFDASGQLMFMISNGSFLKVEADGTISEYLPPIVTHDGLVLSQGFLEIATDGTLFVGGKLETENGFNSQELAIFKVSPEKEVSELVRFNEDFPDFELRYIGDAELDNWGNLYFTGGTADNLIRMSQDGTLEVILQGPVLTDNIPFESPTKLFLDPQGDFYITLSGSNNIILYEPDGSVSEIVAPGQQEEGSYLNAAGSFDFNGFGEMFFRDVYAFGGGYVRYSGGEIQKIIGEEGDGTGVVTHRGVFGHIESYLQFTGQPLVGTSDVVSDSAGNFYTAGAYSDNLFRISRQGSVELLYEDSPYSSISMDSPQVILIDDQDNMYILSTGNTRNIIKIFADPDNPESPQPQSASYADGRLIMPPLLLWGRYFSIELIATNFFPLEFEIGTVMEVEKPADNNYVISESGLIHLPEVMDGNKLSSWDLILDVERILFVPRLSSN